MKKYDTSNYNLYKNDVRENQPIEKVWNLYSKDELVTKFLPLVENIARKFSTSNQATGIMSLQDLIQDGSIGLIKAVNRINWATIFESKNAEKTIKSFLSKRIKGAIRRGVDNNRGTMRIPEHKINEIRQKNDDTSRDSRMFFNAVFASLDEMIENKPYFDVVDAGKQINNETLNTFLLDLLNKHLNKKEKDVIRYSYGLDCDKLSAKEIANKIGIKGDSAYVRVSQLKKQALEKLRELSDYSQVTDYV
tara:strand:+ start:1078 stop:1824 length:747 start_codon:yes stop_codon:yes gene_type:complete